MALHLPQNLAEFPELRPHRSKDLPNLRSLLFDGQRLEAHAEARKNGGQRGGARNDNAVALLEIRDQTRLAEGFGIQPLCGQEHDAEVGGARGIQVLLLDLLSLCAEGSSQRLTGLLNPIGIAGFCGLLNAQVVFLGELGVDGEPDGGVWVVYAPR